MGFGNFRIPEALMVILVGVALGWITGLNTGDQVDAAADNVKWWGPTWTADELFADFSLAGDYIGVIVPLGKQDSASIRKRFANYHLIFQIISLVVLLQVSALPVRPSCAW